jgi:catechol 2,3-dioxygenase-like lactoylglutathione lyase family enzyme
MTSEAQSNWHVRTVFFVRDAERALNFYTKTLGFSLEWSHAPNGRALTSFSILGCDRTTGGGKALCRCATNVMKSQFCLYMSPARLTFATHEGVSLCTRSVRP